MNSAEVSLIIWFLDWSSARLESKNKNPLQMLILYVEDIKPISSKTEKRIKPKMLK